MASTIGFINMQGKHERRMLQRKRLVAQDNSKSTRSKRSRTGSRCIEKSWSGLDTLFHCKEGCVSIACRIDDTLSILVVIIK